MKNGKSPGDYRIVIEAIKRGGPTVLRDLKQLLNSYIQRGPTPSQWRASRFLSKTSHKWPRTDYNNANREV